MTIFWAAVCQLIGHDDHQLTPRDPNITPFVECRRCGRTGWIL